MGEFIGQDEFVVVSESHREALDAFREVGINAYVPRLPFGMVLPKFFTDVPSELILLVVASPLNSPFLRSCLRIGFFQS